MGKGKVKGNTKTIRSTKASVQDSLNANFQHQLDTLTRNVFGLSEALRTRSREKYELEGRLQKIEATSNQVAELFATLRKVLQNLNSELVSAASYTQVEINRMSADEYREKVLVPLGMGRRV